MAKDDYFKLVYAILTELYECKKSGTKVPPDAIHPVRFGIPVSYWLDWTIVNKVDRRREKNQKRSSN